MQATTYRTRSALPGLIALAVLALTPASATNAADFTDNLIGCYAVGKSVRPTFVGVSRIHGILSVTNYGKKPYTEPAQPASADDRRIVIDAVRGAAGKDVEVVTAVATVDGVIGQVRPYIQLRGSDTNVVMYEYEARRLQPLNRLACP